MCKTGRQVVFFKVGEVLFTDAAEAEPLEYMQFRFKVASGERILPTVSRYWQRGMN
jgi:hypothetical protein